MGEVMLKGVRASCEVVESEEREEVEEVEPAAGR